jgi:predicted acyl esterase
MVPMRDGVRLATDVHLPAAIGSFPVIMERTPYGRGETSRSEITAADRTPAARADIAAYFTAHGYAVVYQDTRGRYGSEGRFVKYLSDGEDGYDTCAWLRDQSWCDGRICTMGLSYAAHTQAALACLDPPGLVAQVLDCGGFVNSWQSGIRQSGAFELKQATWAFKNALVSPEAEANSVMRAALAGEDIREWFTRMPWKPGHSPLRHHPDYEEVVGPIEAELFVATDGPDTDFTAKLIDVHPPSADYPKGYAMILTDGILRLRYAEDPARPRLRSPGEVVKIRITLFPTANLFLPDHRIRLDISSSNFPKFDVNPNTGEPEGMAQRRRIAVNTVFVDRDRPSRVVLPLLPV